MEEKWSKKKGVEGDGKRCNRRKRERSRRERLGVASFVGKTKESVGSVGAGPQIFMFS